MGKKLKLSLFDRLLTVWSRVRGWYPVRMGNRSFRCDPENISFWQKVNNNSWEPKTFSALDRLLRAETVYCDIGAWIGPTVLYAGKRCARVYCIEPDRVAYMHLLYNIQLNKLENVLPFNLALSAENTMSRMASPRGKRGDSMTSLLKPKGAGGMDVLCLTWEHWFEMVGKPTFHAMKIDIEGGEFVLLPAMADYLSTAKPSLYLSLHPHLLPEQVRFEAISRIVDALQVYGSCYNSAGEEINLTSLLEGRAVYKAGTYLLLP